MSVALSQPLVANTSSENGRASDAQSTLAITGSNGRAITGSNGRAITGSNGRAITGSNGRAITGSNGRAITGSNGRAITGSNGRAITGSNGRAITGSNGRAITGSNGRAITGSNGRALASYDRFALGLVDIVDVGAGKVVVAGQEFQVDVTGMATGSYVGVGTVNGGSAKAFDIADQYVPGLSIIQIKGVVSAVNASQGTASVGDALVDYTALLSVDPSLTLVPGETVLFSGTQPVPGGVVLATPLSDEAVVVVSNDIQGYKRGGVSGDFLAGTND